VLVLAVGLGIVFVLVDGRFGVGLEVRIVVWWRVGLKSRSQAVWTRMRK